jgi:uncharacterized alpha-E superfamily protein
VLGGAPGQIEIGLKLALELADSTITHRTRYPAEPRPASVLDLVLADPANPRGLLYQLLRLMEHLEALGQEAGAVPALQSASALAERLAGFPWARVEVGPDTVDLGPVLGLLDLVAERLMGISDSLARSFFTHTQATKPVSFTTRPKRRTVPA